jgi:hypothetical protein
LQLFDLFEATFLLLDSAGWFETRLPPYPVIQTLGNREIAVSELEMRDKENIGFYLENNYNFSRE